MVRSPVRNRANGRVYLLVFDNNRLHHVTVALRVSGRHTES
jgi:hypothetical protein